MGSESLASVTTCKFVPTCDCDQLGFGTFRRVARRSRKTRPRTGPIASSRCAGRAMTGKLPGTRRHPILFVFRMAEGHAKTGGKGSGTVMVATQSCFHRDMLDGEPVTSKAFSLDLVPNLRVATFACGCPRFGRNCWLAACG
jgi:hypothetical protein